jgi:4-diphosphocytidyl-2-C-methyl-D-erythritol kinase
VETLRRLCPAKINLYLRVLGRRSDGYHELVTVMQPLSLADELTVTPGGPGLRFSCDHPGLPPGEGNLVWRAARAFEQAAGRRLNVHLTLRKRIPVAAGLGGGSSDAGAALLALNRLADGPLSQEDLHRLARQLGADVPFFLEDGPAVARGVGEILTPLDLSPYWYVLLNPGVPLSTRWVYENLDVGGLAPDPGLQSWDQDHPGDWVKNDLEGVAVRRLPELAARILQLKELGAAAAAVSGSGPTVFGLFFGLAGARSAAAIIRRTFPGWLAVARGLTRHELPADWENDVWML